MDRLQIKKVWVDRKVESRPLTRQILDRLSGCQVEVVDSQEEVLRAIRLASDPMGESKKNLYLTGQLSFIRPCPCSPGCVSCRYWNIDLDLNCPFDCSYCVLQSYLNYQPLTVAINREGLERELEEFLQKKGKVPVRIGTGELADSLGLDSLTNNAIFLTELFRRKEGVWLELKSKSARIQPLLEVKPPSNVILSWSLNPQAVIDSEEKGTASLKERLEAAAAAVKHGYQVGFHFDPIIHYPGWKEEYSQVIASIFKIIPAEAIVWISLGSLRFPPRLKSLARFRFPESLIYEHEFIRTPEGKYRYPRPLRLYLYEEISRIFSDYGAADKLYLCMESAEVWQAFMQKIKRGRRFLAFPFPWLS
ncbi:MAG: spore photoproduct lyase family protein [Candidatus Saccharicenans sp.]